MANYFDHPFLGLDTHCLVVSSSCPSWGERGNAPYHLPRLLPAASLLCPRQLRWCQSIDCHHQLLPERWFIQHLITVNSHDAILRTVRHPGAMSVRTRLIISHASIIRAFSLLCPRPVGPLCRELTVKPVREIIIHLITILQDANLYCSMLTTVPPSKGSSWNAGNRKDNCTTRVSHPWLKQCVSVCSHQNVHSPSDVFMILFTMSSVHARSL